MKKLVIILITLMLSSGLMAQNKAVAKLFDKYSGREGYTSVVITKHMFSLFSQVETTEDDEYMNMIKNLDNIRILSAPGSTASGINFMNELKGALPENEYEELMVIKDGSQDVKFLVKEEHDKVVELLMIVSGPEENVLISINGIIDMQTVAKLSKSMNIEGMENLEKIEKEFPR